LINPGEMHRAWLAALQSMGGIPAGQIGWYIWADGGMTPFRSTKGTTYEGGMRVPCIVRWPGKIKPGMVENGIFSGLDWLPTLAAAAGNPNITQQLLQGVTLGGRNYKNHLDGYNQMDLLLGTGPSARHEIFYFGGPKLGAIRIDDFKFQFFSETGPASAPSRALAVFSVMSASLIGRFGSSTSDCPPVQFRCRSRARASLRTRHQALPSWVSKTRWNNLLVGLARRTAGSSRHTNSPHPSSREGHYSTTRWNSSVLLLG
jgi:hypothetical protein